MPARVVDASALIAFAFAEVRGPEIQRHIQGHELHVPSLVTYELANAAVTKTRRHPEEADSFARSLRVASALAIHTHAVRPEAVSTLAVSLGLTAYDAASLWLALRLAAPLIALDAQLGDVARGLGLLAR